MDFKINKLPLMMMKTDYKSAYKYVMYSLILISLISIISVGFQEGIAYSIKIILIIITSVFVARETEILFITHNQNIFRKQAKEQIKETYPMITGLILALIIPIGTPIFVVVIASFISIFIGKMVFGGFSYNPFNPAIIGRIFIALSFEPLINNNLNKGLTNYLLIKIFNVSEINTSTLNEVSSYAFSFNTSLGNIGDIGFVLLIVIALVLVFKNLVSLINIVLPISIFTIIIYIVTKDINYTILLLATNSVLFCLVYLANDPITSPISNYGRVIYSTIIGVTSAVMIYLGNANSAILYAILFANMFVPLINSNTLKLKINADIKTLKLIILVLIVVAFTTVLINITSNETAKIVGELL